MKYISKAIRGQQTFLPESIDEYVGAESPVRVIDAFVDGRDIKTLVFNRAVPSYTGRPPYDPRDLLKLYICKSRRDMLECIMNGTVPHVGLTYDRLASLEARRSQVNNNVFNLRIVLGEV